MERILGFIKWSLIVVFLLVLAWMGLAASEWLPRPTDVQRKSLAILDRPPVTAKGQHNAFAAIWLSQYDIPAADLEAVADNELARYRTAAPGSSSLDRYARSSLLDGAHRTLCTSSEEDCLAKIRRNADATRKLLGDSAVLLDHAHALARYDHDHDRFPPGTDSPLPEIGGMAMLQLSDAALRFADGDKPEGLLRACAAASTWRRLALHSDSRVVQSVASNYYTGASALVAEMLAELPLDAALPEPCNAAFAPVADQEMTGCDAMKSEFHKNAVFLQRADSLEGTGAKNRSGTQWSKTLGRLLINAPAATALSAPGYASFCTQDADVLQAAARMDTAPLRTSCGVQGTLFDPMGCVLVAVGNPTRIFAAYAARMRDVQTMNTLINAVLMQRKTAAVSSIAGMPDATGGTGLPPGVTMDAQNHLLHIKRAFTRSGERDDFAIPMPASRLQDAALH